MRTRRPCWPGPFVPSGSSIWGGHLSMVVWYGSQGSLWKVVSEPVNLPAWQSRAGSLRAFHAMAALARFPFAPVRHCCSFSTLLEPQEAALRGLSQWRPGWALWLLRPTRRRLELSPWAAPLVPASLSVWRAVSHSRIGSLQVLVATSSLQVQLRQPQDASRSLVDFLKFHTVL